MNTRLALYGLMQRHRLDPSAAELLWTAAGLRQEPAAVRRWLWPAVTMLASALGGFGVILWLAANWDTLGRTGRFALLQGVVVAMCVGAAWRDGLRGPLALLAFICTGGLFAYFGQTYQTGADPWQLFALWAALGVPLALGARSDLLWAPWALVAMVGISLWTYAHGGRQFQVEAGDLAVHTLAWVATGAVVVAVCPAWARFTGAGPWALRTAATLAVISISVTALVALFGSRVAPHYFLALGLLVVAAGVLALPRAFEVFVLSAVALALDTLLVAAFARFMFEGTRDGVGAMLIVGLAAAALLAASVSAILRLSRRHAVGSDA